MRMSPIIMPIRSAFQALFGVKIFSKIKIGNL